MWTKNMSIPCKRCRITKYNKWETVKRNEEGEIPGQDVSGEEDDLVDQVRQRDIVVHHLRDVEPQLLDDER